VILNPAPAQPLPPELLALVDAIIPNETEATSLTGIAVVDQASAGAAARQLHEQGVETVVVTLGAGGALLHREGASAHVPAFPVRAVDTTAAGDAFVAGFALALAEGMSWPDAVRFGNAAGALAATRPGAQPSLPTRNEVEQLLQVRPPNGCQRIPGADSTD
jgi:ribokinase